MLEEAKASNYTAAACVTSTLDMLALSVEIEKYACRTHAESPSLQLQRGLDALARTNRGIGLRLLEVWLQEATDHDATVRPTGLES